MKSPLTGLMKESTTFRVLQNRGTATGNGRLKVKLEASGDPGAMNRIFSLI